MRKFDLFQDCLLCGSQQIHPLKGYQGNYLVKCVSCQFVFCQRKPAADELKAHYDLYPRGNVIPSITLKRYDELLDKFETYRKTNNLIDIGCGDGFFLMQAKKRKWNIYGTEFSPGALDVCRQKGISMTVSPLDAGNYEPDYFDIITSFEVIEHVNTPVSELVSFHKILRKGGLVYITTPNFNSISRDIVGPKWNIIGYPEHLSYYTRRTLSKLFRDGNFRLLKISTTGVSISRIRRSTSGALSDGFDEGIRQKTDRKFIFRWLKSGANYFLNAFGKGDSMKALFIKN